MCNHLTTNDLFKYHFVKLNHFQIPKLPYMKSLGLSVSGCVCTCRCVCACVFVCLSKLPSSVGTYLISPTCESCISFSQNTFHPQEEGALYFILCHTKHTIKRDYPHVMFCFTLQYPSVVVDCNPFYS